LISFLDNDVAQFTQKIIQRMEFFWKANSLKFASMLRNVLSKLGNSHKLTLEEVEWEARKYLG
jgi:hypothetical protein